MAEAEEAPQEEPDTPIEELAKDPTMDVIVKLAAEIITARQERELAQEHEDELKTRLLPLMLLKSLHGIRTVTGHAVRRAWSVRTTATPDPARLRELMADADLYIRETVDLPKLKREYPTIWEQAGRVKRTETIAVRLKGET